MSKRRGRQQDQAAKHEVLHTAPFACRILDYYDARGEGMFGRAGRTVLASDFRIQLRCGFAVDCGQLLLDLDDLLSKVLFEAKNMWIIVRHQLEVLKRLQTALQRFEELKANYFSGRISTLHSKRFLAVAAKMHWRTAAYDPYVFYFQSTWMWCT